VSEGRRFEGKVALVTGAARGQGRSHALRLAAEGADVIVLDFVDEVATVQYRGARPEDLEQTVKEVEATGARVVPLQVDVRDRGALEAGVDKAVDALGPLDVAVANAGIISYRGSALELTDEDWRDVIDIDLTGVWNTCRAALPSMVDRGGSIVVISSMAGLKGYPGVTHYSAAKHGVVGLARSLAVEFGPRKVRVNSVHPTTVDTEMIRAEEMYRMFRPDLDEPGFEDMAAVAGGMHILDGPWVESEDVSNCVAFLASDEARALTGVALPVDLGAAIR
jgi:SDR family mycofactocin-dependent oxidoreductase